VPDGGATYTANFRPQSQAQDDLIFADDFESSDLMAWDIRARDDGDLSAEPQAAMVGSHGLRAEINDDTWLSVGHIMVDGEDRYRARFHFDPNSTRMAEGDTLELFRGFMDTWPAVVEIQMRYAGGAYFVRAGLLDDDTTWGHTLWFRIADAPHSLELDWKVATAPGANDGSLTFWINGVERGNVTEVDNDTRRINRVRLGPLSSIDDGTRGTLYFDAFEARRLRYIGPANGAAALTVEVPDPAELYSSTEEEMDAEDLQQPSAEEALPDLYIPWTGR
jgi:hypothetical protein